MADKAKSPKSSKNKLSVMLASAGLLAAFPKVLSDVGHSLRWAFPDPLFQMLLIICIRGSLFWY